MTRRKTRRAWGSVTEVQRGRKYVLRWMENTPGGRKRKTKTVRGTYREACMELDRIHVERADDKPVPTISQAYETWLIPTMAAQVEAGTLARNTRDLVLRSWRNYVGPQWGKMPVDQLRPVQLQEWLLTLPAATADTALLTLRKIYIQISGFTVLPIDPFAASVRYTMPTRKTRERSKRLYTLDEALDVLGKLRGTSLEAPFILACFGSCRSGESLGVRAGEVHAWPCGGTVLAAVDIARQMEQNGVEPTADGRLKTAKSVRTVVILPQASARLIEIVEQRQAEGSEWLCDRGDGLPMNRGICNNRWSKLCEREGIEHIPWANLRNSWRTIAEMELHMPWDLMEVLMGHSLPGVSGRHYIRPSQEQIVRSVCDALGMSWDISQQSRSSKLLC